MSLVLTNALLADIDPPRVEPGALRIEGGIITERNQRIDPQPGDETIDCGGAVVLPGLVNGHTHLYSSLAVGMPPPPRTPTNFREILELVWWRLDRALDEESIEMSARIGAMNAVQCGTTTLIDHHASPNCIAGSLDLVEDALNDLGMRAALCYETTDRNGQPERDEGLAENERFAQKCRSANQHRSAALIGAHALFTLDNDTLDALADLTKSTQTGLHIHVAEDQCDEDLCRREHDLGLIDRLERHHLLTSTTVIAHGTHLSLDAIRKVNAAGLTLAHNARSNMNNAVGYTPVGSFENPVMLGTDGIGGDMLAEAKAAWFKSRDGHAGIGPDQIVQMLANAARRASASLGLTLGKLEIGAAADLVITDYTPSTLLTTDNLPGHMIFGMNSLNVVHVIVDGQFSIRDRHVTGCDEIEVRTLAREVASRLWRRMNDL